MRFADTRKRREHKEGPELLGSPQALGVLFSGGYPMQVVRHVDRKARRKALAQTWSRAVMAKMPHPLAAARAADSNPERSMKSVAKRLANRPAPKFAPRPRLRSLVTLLLESEADRRTARRVIRRAGYAWQAVSKRWSIGRRAVAK